MRRSVAIPGALALSTSVTGVVSDISPSMLMASAQGTRTTLVSATVHPRCTIVFRRILRSGRR